VQVRNLTRDTILAERAELAASFWARGRGLLGRHALTMGEGIVLYPNNSVHTFFMRFPIDVVFADTQARVVGLRANMPPQRPFAGAWRARYTIELPVGMIAQSGTTLGDQLAFSPPLPG
jgi:uncharacterized protein